MTYANPNRIEHLIVMQVCDREQWSLTELKNELSDVEPLTVNRALESLFKAGVIHQDGEQVWVAGAVRHVDGPEMVSI